MVGDKFETDILMAANAQIDSTLVLTGETKLE
jgi:ribonucleotide monophosphatase NagD (HAD superfamily)